MATFTIDFNTLTLDAELTELFTKIMPANEGYLPITNRLARHFITSVATGNEDAVYGGHPALSDDISDEPLATGLWVFNSIRKNLNEAREQAVCFSDEDANISSDYLYALSALIAHAFSEAGHTTESSPSEAWDDAAMDAEPTATPIAIDFTELFNTREQNAPIAELVENCMPEDDYYPITNRLARHFIEGLIYHDEVALYQGHPELTAGEDDAITISSDVLPGLHRAFRDAIEETVMWDDADADISRDYLTVLAEMVWHVHMEGTVAATPKKATTWDDFCTSPVTEPTLEERVAAMEARIEKMDTQLNIIGASLDALVESLTK